MQDPQDLKGKFVRVIDDDRLLVDIGQVARVFESGAGPLVQLRHTMPQEGHAIRHCVVITANEAVEVTLKELAHIFISTDTADGKPEFSSSAYVIEGRNQHDRIVHLVRRAYGLLKGLEDARLVERETEGVSRAVDMVLEVDLRLHSVYGNPELCELDAAVAKKVGEVARMLRLAAERRRVLAAGSRCATCNVPFGAHRPGCPAEETEPRSVQHEPTYRERTLGDLAMKLFLSADKGPEDALVNGAWSTPDSVIQEAATTLTSLGLLKQPPASAAE